MSASFATVQRASQIDAQRLDDELLSLFLSETRSSLRFLPSSTLDAYTPELTFLLRLFFFCNTYLRARPSPGLAFQNLCHRPHPHPLRHFLLIVALPYLWTRLRAAVAALDWARRGGPRRRAWRALNGAEAVARALTLANLLAFLRDGRYRSVADRVARAPLRYAARTAPRAPAFEFVHSQLVWEGVAEFALFLAPMLAGGGAAGWRWWGRATRGQVAASATTRPAARGRACARCGAGEIVMPHRGLPCRHVFCYVCVQGGMEDGGLRCGECGAGVRGTERVKFA